MKHIPSNINSMLCFDVFQVTMSSEYPLPPRGWDGRVAMTASYRQWKRARHGVVEGVKETVAAQEAVGGKEALAGVQEAAVVEDVVEEARGGEEVAEEAVGGDEVVEGVGGDGVDIDFGEDFGVVAEEGDVAGEGDGRG
ncbi:hypothetical protein Dimus_039037 [Dionaea muscipula]